ncbi:MAG: hypothetical protein M3R51_06285, partial [Candidatus Eremiobacteraeota bacterium]|nr:hypothetical protein [Candidatus Eremiobacteraeota bacterium]
MRTPAGTLLIEARGDVLVASHFAPRARVTRVAPRNAMLCEAQAQVHAYCARKLRRFDVSLSFAGTPFQIAVWTLVAQLETGEL